MEIILFLAGLALVLFLAKKDMESSREFAYAPQDVEKPELD